MEKLIEKVKGKLEENGLKNIHVDGIYSGRDLIGIRLYIYDNHFKQIYKKVFLKGGKLNWNAVLKKARELENERLEIEKYKKELIEENKRLEELIKEVKQKAEEILGDLKLEVYLYYDMVYSSNGNDRFELKIKNLKKEQVFKILNAFKQIKEAENDE